MSEALNQVISAIAQGWLSDQRRRSLANSRSIQLLQAILEALRSSRIIILAQHPTSVSDSQHSLLAARDSNAVHDYYDINPGNSSVFVSMMKRINIKDRVGLLKYFAPLV